MISRGVLDDELFHRGAMFGPPLGAAPFAPVQLPLQVRDVDAGGNPNVVPQNMPGGGSFNAANHIYTIAPKDGTVLGIIARDAALGPLSGATGARARRSRQAPAAP